MKKFITVQFISRINDNVLQNKFNADQGNEYDIFCTQHSYSLNLVAEDNVILQLLFFLPGFNFMRDAAAE
jgi:hypothetical protein